MEIIIRDESGTYVTEGKLFNEIINMTNTNETQCNIDGRIIKIKDVQKKDNMLIIIISNMRDITKLQGRNLHV